MVLGWGKKTAAQQDTDEEMSMEEILASIRKYVSEDSGGKEPEEEKVEKAGYSQDSSSSLAFDPRQVPQFEPRNAFDTVPEAAAVIDKPVFRSMVQETLSQTELDSYGENLAQDYGLDKPSLDRPSDTSIRPENIKQQEEKSIMSESTASMASKSFSKLIDLSRASQSQEASKPSLTASAVTLDQLVAELARPMIQNWVDTNLPTMVEQMVSAEINRITQRLGLK